MTNFSLFRTLKISGGLLLSLCTVSVLESCKGSSDPSSRVQARGSAGNGSSEPSFGLYKPTGGDEITYESRSKSWTGDNEPADWSQVDSLKERVLGLYKVDGDSSCVLRKETTYGNTQVSTVMDVCKAATSAANECSSSKCEDAVDVGAKTFGSFQDATGKKIVCRTAFPMTLPGGQKKVTVSYTESTTYTHADAQNDENLVFQSTHTCSISVDDNGQALDSYLSQDPCASKGADKIVSKSEKEFKSFTAGQGTSDFTVKPSAKFWVKNESKESRDAEPTLMMQKMSVGGANNLSLSVSKSFCEKDPSTSKSSFKNVSFSTTIANDKAENKSIPAMSATLLQGSSVFMSQDGCKYSLGEKSGATGSVTGSVSCSSAFTSLTDKTLSGELESLEFTGVKPDGFGVASSGSGADSGSGAASGVDSGSGGDGTPTIDGGSAGTAANGGSSSSTAGNTNGSNSTTNSTASGSNSSSGNTANGTSSAASGGSGSATSGQNSGSIVAGGQSNGGQQGAQVARYGAGGPRGASFVLASLPEARKCAARIAAMSKTCLRFARYGQIESTTASLNYIVPGARWCTCDNGIGQKDKLPWKKGSAKGF